MSLTNPYGDQELTDPQALRALAHPTRLAILSRLQRHGPATATQLAPHVSATPSVASWHLRHLARFGLVEDWDGVASRRERGWQAVARGFRFELPDDAAGQEAARQLHRQLMAQASIHLQQWTGQDEGRLPIGWQRLAGLSNTRIALTQDELEQVEARLEEVLAPFVRRSEADAPAGARGVRLLRYVLPEALDDETLDDETLDDDDGGGGYGDDDDDGGSVGAAGGSR